MKKNVILSFFLLFFCALAFAQQADRVTAMINAPNVTFNQAAYFASSYLGLGSENMSDAEAGKMLAGFSSFPKLNISEQPLTLKEFAYFCLKVWKIKGGIGYTVFKAPRYALKELKALGFVPVFADPDTYVTGRDALYIMGKCADYAETHNAREGAK